MNAVDMSQFIAPKSDQINADDLIGGPLTIRVTRVSANETAPEQPINIFYEGDDGKPFRPCKSMRRVMVHIWGADANKYVGRSMTLYRDPKVKFGGMQVGGIRISHMTDIPADKLSDGKVQMALTESKAKRTPFTVWPLTVEAKADAAAEWVAEQIAAITQCADVESLDALTSKGARAMGKLQGERADLHGQVLAAYAEKRSQLAGNEPGATMLPADDDPFDPGTGGVTEGPAAYQGFVAGIETRIETATTAEQLDAITDDVEQASHVPEAEKARLDVLVSKKMRALRKAG